MFDLCFSADQIETIEEQHELSASHGISLELTGLSTPLLSDQFRASLIALRHDIYKPPRHNHADKSDPTSVVSFGEIVLKRREIDKTTTTTAASPVDLVMCETTQSALRILAMSVLTDYFVLVEGASSSGKTSLVEHIAGATRNRLIKYQMDYYMDSKSLVGSYVCSSVPGEFVWKAGPLYEAVAADCWLLLEDVDESPVDSLALLIDFMEKKSLQVVNTDCFGSSIKLF